LARLGAKIQEITMAPLATYVACYATIMESEAYAIHEQWLRERPQDYGELARGRLLAGAFIRASDYVNAQRVRRKLSESFHALFSGIDVALSANSMDPACRIDDARTLEINFRRQARTPFNITGSPALSVPAGFSRSGLPLAIQLAGAPFTEALLYRVAHAYEQAAGWTARHPALA
jgi:aspartyl-tRNA(Asn)/glutamyl-tRNA(Gln) amidotransferase subunit A